MQIERASRNEGGGSRMTRYEVDTTRRSAAWTLTLLASVALAPTFVPATNKMVHWLIERTGPASDMVNLIFPHAFTFVTIWAVLWQILDKIAWRVPPIHGLIGVPYVGGKWSGTMDRKDFNTHEMQKDVPVSMAIKQTLTKISIRYWSNHNTRGKAGTPSEATLIKISTDGDSISICYAFHFNNGKGYCEMHYSKRDRNWISARYFSNVPRVGAFELERA